MKRNYLPIAVAGLCLAGQVFAAKTIPNHAIADLVLGQPDFVSAAIPTIPSSFVLDSPSSVTIDPISGKVFVADRDHQRVLRYANAASLKNGAGAEAVLGQPRFSSEGGLATAEGMGGGYGLFLDRFGRLWVADSFNARVLLFEAAAYRHSSSSADRFFGQPNFTTTSAGTTSTKMNFPVGVCVDSADRLWVSDYNGNRILRFDSISTKPSGDDADGVLGQPNFTSSTSGTTGSSLKQPGCIAISSNGSLFVADSTNHRILRFDNAASLANGAGASAVLGQSNFTTGTSGVSASKMSTPFGLFLTPDDTLWVTENGAARVLRFSKASTKGADDPADGVVGQPDFVTNAASVTQRGLATSSFNQPFVDSAGSLWVPDSSNDRVLRFPPDVTRPVLTVTTKVPKTTNSNKLTVKGTATDTYGITKIQYQVGSGSLKTATGTTSWKFTAGLASGTNKIKIFAVDSVGNKSTVKTITIKRS